MDSQRANSGHTPELLGVKNLELQRGRFISSVDNRNAWNVAVLSTGAAERMFKYQDPLGKPILLGEDVYRVIGILGSRAGVSDQEDANEEIYIPLSCAQRRFGE